MDMGVRFEPRTVTGFQGAPVGGLRGAAGIEIQFDGSQAGSDRFHDMDSIEYSSCSGTGAWKQEP